MDDLSGLNESQRRAVLHRDGPLLVLAGPGSGKTRVVTHRIANLLNSGVSPKQILALTFTNKAADEMGVRLRKLAPQQRVWLGTFHRFCAQLLRVHASLVGLTENYSILDSEDSRRLLRQVVDELGLDLTHVTYDSISAGISFAKSKLITPADYVASPGSTLGPILSQVYPAYQRRLLGSNAVDFDDLLLHIASMLRENPELRHSLDERYRYIMVDEYQDTNLAQYAIVRGLSVDCPNLAVTGDPDQSIYGWRGADVSNILEFERDYPNVTVVRLEQNYRSTQRILHVAQHLICNNKRRKDKALFTANDEGALARLTIYPTARDEADDIGDQILHRIQNSEFRPRDFAILYRTNSLSRQFEHALSHRGIPYQVVQGLEFYQRKEVKDVLAYLQLINNPKNDVAFERIVNCPPRSIGKTTVSRLGDFARQTRISTFEAARRVAEIDAIADKNAAAVSRFVNLMDELSAMHDDPIHIVMDSVIRLSGYRDQLESSEFEDDRDRLANLDELVSAAREFFEEHPDDNSLERFLEQTALVSDTDAWESESDRVNLMTLHAAKGLEFPAVYIVAIEEGILPHERSMPDPDKLEEERRLLFVGITRAERDLQLSMSLYRNRGGRDWPTVASQFLMEVPRLEMQIQEPKSTSRRKPLADEHGWEADVSYDNEWCQDVPTPTIADRPVTRDSSNLVTAAQMLGDSGGGAPLPLRIPPENIREGMIVAHPQYGPGRVAKVSGDGNKRSAKIRFATVGEKTIYLVHSVLAPIGSEFE